MKNIKKIISAAHAAKGILIILGLLIVIHLLVIMGIIPSAIIWGGNIESNSILPLELIAIVVTICFGLFVLIKMRYLKEDRKSIFANIVLWLITLFFVFNIVTNSLSDSVIEKLIFIPIAFILALLTFRLAIE